MSRDTSVTWGIPLQALVGDDLNFVPSQFSRDPIQTFDFPSKFESYRQQIQEDYGWDEAPDILDDPKQLWQVYRRFPIEYFSDFTFDELTKTWFSDVIMSTISDTYERRRTFGRDDERIPPEPLEFVYKLRNSQHHYGYPINWNTLVTAYYAIPDFDFAPGFDVRFDHSPYFNEWGGAQHVRDYMRTVEMPWKQKEQYWTDNELYLDGVFGYLVHYKGVHVMTIGFSLGRDCIYLCQIQIRQPKGNRWLYKIPTGYFNYTVEQMVQHFNSYGLDVYLADGKSLADKVKSLYPDEIELDPQAYHRMISIYSQPLDNYVRGKKDRRKKIDYHLLLPYPRQLRNPIRRQSVLLSRLKQLTPQLAQAAQHEVDEWWGDDDEEDMIIGGACDEVSRAMADVLAEAGIDCLSGGHDGDDHAWLIAYDLLHKEAVGVDIPARIYETGGGYVWEKIPDAHIDPDDVELWSILWGDVEENFEELTRRRIY